MLCYYTHCTGMDYEVPEGPLISPRSHCQKANLGPCLFLMTSSALTLATLGTSLSAIHLCLPTEVGRLLRTHSVIKFGN